MIVLGITGSIGMGKSTTAAMFRDAGVPVHDSDEAVHRLYRGKAAPLVEAVFPGTTSVGIVDREKLARRVFGNPAAMKRLITIIHPLVRADAGAFVDRHRQAGADLAVLDIPLLFETGGEDRVDRILVVTAPPDLQRQRVLSRPNMSVKKFEAVLAKQMPDADKRAAADYVIDTGRGMDAVRQDIADLIADLRGQADASLAVRVPGRHPGGERTG